MSIAARGEADVRAPVPRGRVVGGSSDLRARTLRRSIDILTRIAPPLLTPRPTVLCRAQPQAMRKWADMIADFRHRQGKVAVMNRIVHRIQHMALASGMSKWMQLVHRHQHHDIHLHRQMTAAQRVYVGREKLVAGRAV